MARATHVLQRVLFVNFPVLNSVVEGKKVAVARKIRNFHSKITYYNIRYNKFYFIPKLISIFP